MVCASRKQLCSNFFSWPFMCTLQACDMEFHAKNDYSFRVCFNIQNTQTSRHDSKDLSKPKRFSFTRAFLWSHLNTDTNKHKHTHPDTVDFSSLFGL